MATATQTKRTTVEEWLPVATPRAELVDGVESVLRTFESPNMQSTSARHALTCRRIAAALDRALTASDSPCQVLNEGPVVEVSQHYGRVPDVSIVCELDNLDEHRIEPSVVIEVISESTASVDYGAKVREYLSLDFVKHYLVVDARERVVTHYRPNKAEATRYTDADNTIDLYPPGISISLVGIFDYR